MIGKTIKSILTTNVALIALVPAAKMFPCVMNEDTAAPALMYKIDSIESFYDKGGWTNDIVTFSVFCVANSYALLQNIASAVRTALELQYTGTGTQDINRIYLIGYEEGYGGGDELVVKLTFHVTVNNY